MLLATRNRSKEKTKRLETMRTNDEQKRSTREMKMKKRQQNQVNDERFLFFFTLFCFGKRRN